MRENEQRQCSRGGGAMSERGEGQAKGRRQESATDQEKQKLQDEAKTPRSKNSKVKPKLQGAKTLRPFSLPVRPHRQHPAGQISLHGETARNGGMRCARELAQDA
eukprot:2669020-Pleurochrysis_carterae.AAC.2